MKEKSNRQYAQKSVLKLCKNIVLIFDVKKYIVNSSDEFRNKSKKIAKKWFYNKKILK